MKTLLASVALAFLALGCSSSDDGGTNGGGSGASSGCVTGATQLCVGPGACNGAQVCGSSQTWGVCNCGGGWAGSSGSGGLGSGGGAGSGGLASGGGGSGAGPSSLDLHDAVIHDNPADLADWPVTTSITKLDFQYGGQDGVHVEFSKQDGEGRWPDVTPPGWDGPLQYTLGMAEYIDGIWHASAAIQYWYGLEASGGNVALDNQVAKNWYYDGRWGQMAGYQPATGEWIGIFVVAGNVRGVTDGSQSPAKERSNVVVVPMPDVNGSSHTF